MGFNKIAVLMGGASNEREVSLVSGKAISTGLRKKGYDVTELVLDGDFLPKFSAKIEAVFIAMHGGYGEGGGLQADLDSVRMPYTGSGALASKLAMDKNETKAILLANNVPTPRYAILRAGQNELQELVLPVVVKPPRDGSSVGVTRVDNMAQWQAAVAAARKCDPLGEVLVEEYIAGREWTVGILDEMALPAVEIRAPGGWYGYDAKYKSSEALAPAQRTEYIFPESSEDQLITKACQKYALATYNLLKCRGMGRVDFRIGLDGTPYVLEINTIPGFTPTSLLPKAAARAGIDFPQLCAHIMERAKFGD